MTDSDTQPVGFQDSGAAVPPPAPEQVSAADAARLASELITALQRVLDRRYSYRGAEKPEIPCGTEERLASFLGADGPVPPAVMPENVLVGVDPYQGRYQESSLIREALATIRWHDYATATAVRLVTVLGCFRIHSYGPWSWTQFIGETHARTGEPDLLALQRMLDAAGADGRSLVWTAYSHPRRQDQLGRVWPDEQVRPFLEHNLDWITAKELAARPDGFLADHALFAAIPLLPRLPEQLVELLYAQATGAQPSWASTRAAQDALDRDPRRVDRAAGALRDRRAGVRLTSAQWLARIADPAVLPALRAAWTAEKQDNVRGALLDALVAVGEDAGTYLGPADVLAAAGELAAKGLPSGLDWLDWESLPELSWTPSGKRVPRAVTQWLCAVAVKGKSAEPSGLLRHCAALLDRDARERLAARLLAEWMNEKPTSSRGVLAVVAACGGGEVVPPVERFLKDWHGQVPQSKTLLSMLAWVDHPRATQLVLATATRFRARSVQEEATRLSAALAERQGWTIGELADRAIPTAGFGDDGILELPYGPRTFTALLCPDLTVELRDPTGKVIKALPSPRQSDDTGQAKESKKALSAAKKELKTIAALQTQRLYEAMCTERTWSAGDWDRFLLHHPVAGPMVRRLVWTVTATDGDSDRADDVAPASFRPLDDGTLTDAGDNDVTLPPGGRIGLAHDSLLSAEEAAQWTAHLADYEISPLFPQLGRDTFVVTPELRSARKITDFTGHMLETLPLRSRAGQLGYVRGEIGDGAWFRAYKKRFPALGIVALIHFTGSSASFEENRPAALEELSFRRDDEERSGPDLAFGDLPAVLVSECWQDLRLLAATGTGFDPEWQRKT